MTVCPAILRNRTIWAFLLLQLGGLLLYATSFGHGWTYDDFPIVVRNPDIRSLGAFFADNHPGRPLRELSYLLDYRLFGQQPAGYHLQNIFWHALNAFLLLNLALRLKLSRSAAWLATLLFLVHPLQVEAVANIGNRKESLTLAFCLLALLSYARALSGSKGRPLLLLASAACATLAWLSKQTAITLPAVLLAYEWCLLSPERRLLLRPVRLWQGLLVAGPLAFGIWFLALGGSELFLQESLARLQRLDASLGASSPGLHLLTVLKAAAFQFSKLLVPLELAPDYAFPLPSGLADPWVVTGLLGGVAWIAGVWWWQRRQPTLCFALLWLAAFWLPTSNLWPFNYFAADRYLYAPSVGFCLLLAGLLSQGPPARRLRPVLAAVLLLILAGLSWRQIGIWQSEEHLWSHTVQVSPRSSHALSFLGMIKLDKGDLAEAEALHLRALRMNPRNPLSHLDLGRIYELRRDRQRARHHFRTFVQLDPPRYRTEVAQVRAHLQRWYGPADDGEH